MSGMPEVTKRYLTPLEMSAQTGLSVHAIRRAIAAGEMPAIRMGRGRKGAIHVRCEVFEQWLLRKEQQGTEAGEAQQ